MEEKKLVPKKRFKNSSNIWKYEILGDFTEIKTGPFGSALHASSYVENGIPIITTEHFKNGFLPTSEKGLPQVSLRDYKRLNVYKLELRDIVFSRVGSVDINALVEDEQEGWLFSGRVLRVKVENNYSSLFLHYLLQTKSVKKSIVNRSVGQTMPSINTQILKNTCLYLTSDIKEQQKIGEFFKVLDERIANQERKIAKVKALKEAYLTEMFPQEGEAVPKRRFKEFEGEWEKFSLENMGNTFSGMSGKTKNDFGHGEAKFVTYVNVFNNPISDKVGLEKVILDNKQTTLKYGDILFTTSSETPDEVGMSSVWLFDKPNVYLNSFCFGFRPKIKMDQYFIGFLLRANHFRNQMKILAQGISRYNISKNKVMEIEVLLPSIEEQQKIGAFFKNLDDQIRAEESKLEKLKKMKEAYLEEMFV